jgi:hypothetical protein
MPGQRIFLWEDGKPMKLSRGDAGKSGRRKLVIVDWDRDGRLDILINSRSIDFLRNVGTGGRFLFRNMGPVDSHRLAGHTTCPCVVDWDRDGTPDLLVGAEDGFLYFLENPHPIKPVERKEAQEPGKHLVAAWDFEDANGGPLADKATAGTVKDALRALGDAAVSGGVARIPATAGSAFRAESSADLEQPGELTIWLRLRVAQNPASFVSLVDKRRFRNPEERSYGLYIPPGPKTPEFYAVGGQVSFNGTASGAVAFTGAAETLPVGAWREAAMVVAFEGHCLAVRWYAATGAEPRRAEEFPCVGGPVTRPGLARLHVAKQPLTVGNDVGLRALPTPLEIDAVRIYDRALSPEELAEIP